MSSGNPADNRADTSGEPISQQVAELAGELSETEDLSRRKRIARQIPRLASRSKHATVRSVQSGTGAVARRVRPARETPAGETPARETPAGRVRPGRRVAVRSAQAVRTARSGGSATLRGLRASGQWLAAQAIEMAPKVPIRTIATLRAQYPALDTEQLADRLITSASRASGGLGAAVGAAAAVPFIPTVPVELGVETLGLVAIELKLIAELHEVYGMPAPGSPAQRMLAYVGAWTERRSVQITAGGIAFGVGSPLRRKLERRLLAKAGRSALALAPLLAGAAAGVLIDHRETRLLGSRVREDLRKRSRDAAASIG